MVDIQNAAMSEFNTSYRTAEYLLIDTVGDYYQRAALKKLYVYRYALKNPDSYVALWQISRYISDGYNKYLDSAFDILSEKIKNTETGKLIRNDLDHLALTDTGKIFPDLTLTDMHGYLKNFSEISIENLRINSYPSNFLIDSSGKILAINLGASEVADYIRKKLD